MKTLSKSDFILALDCPAKLTWRERGYPATEDDNPYLALLAEGGYMVEQLARLLFPDGVELHYDRTQPEEAWEEARRALESGSATCFEATLLSGRKLVRVDILRRTGNHFDLFEVKSKSFGDELVESPAGPFRQKRAPHSILAPWLPYLQDVAYQVHVLKECYPGATVTPHLIVVDRTATSTVDGLPGMFSITREGDASGQRDLAVRFIGNRSAIDPGELLQTLVVDSEVNELLAGVAEAADAMVARYTDDGVAHEAGTLGMHCAKCDYRVGPGVSPSGFRECWGRLAGATPSILDLYKFGGTKWEGEKLGDVMISNGAVTLPEVDRRHLVKKDGSPTAASARQLVQIEYTARNVSWTGPGLARKLGEAHYPLHFIDFETSALALPYHAGMRPYQSIGFQWSCHTVRAAGEAPEHREWLNGSEMWPCLEFAESLQAAIGDDGDVLMWSPHERTTLKGVRQQLIDYGRGSKGLIEWLAPMAEKEATPQRLKDQHAICVAEFFHPRMEGRTSIKRVLDALWSTDLVLREQFATWMGSDAFTVPKGKGPYEALPPVVVGGTELDVADGTGAMRAYQAMLYGAERGDTETKAAWDRLLRRYCKLDTLAMVLIWEHWRRVVQGAGEHGGSDPSAASKGPLVID